MAVTVEFPRSFRLSGSLIQRSTFGTGVRAIDGRYIDPPCKACSISVVGAEKESLYANVDERNDGASASSPLKKKKLAPSLSLSIFQRSSSISPTFQVQMPHAAST